MINPVRNFFLFILLFTATQAGAQRCAGKFYFRIYNSADNAVYPLLSDTARLGLAYFGNQFAWSPGISNINGRMLYDRFSITAFYPSDTLTFKPPVSTSKWNDTSTAKSVLELYPLRTDHNAFYFMMNTACGISQCWYEMQAEGQTMRIEFRNLTGDTDFVMDSIPFTPGNFIIDVAGSPNKKESPGMDVNYHDIWGYVVSAQLVPAK